MLLWKGGIGAASCHAAPNQNRQGKALCLLLLRMGGPNLGGEAAVVFVCSLGQLYASRRFSLAGVVGPSIVRGHRRLPRTR